jgi:starvation-inducible DNA-binding protein
MNKTKNDLPQETRVKIIELCQVRLADSIDVMMQAKQAHWNVKGPSFIALHELFDKVSEESEEWVDSIAERIVQLGGIAEGTVYASSKRTTLKQYPLSITSGADHVDHLSTALAHYGKEIRHAIDLAAEFRDADTADLFTEISRSNDKFLWFVESHLQTT